MNLAVWAERIGVARVTVWATAEQIPVDKVLVEVGSALNGHRRRFGSEYVEAVLAAQGRELVVVGSAEVDDDLVRDMTAILTSMCARLYGKGAAQNRAKGALAAAVSDDSVAA
jgi:predicted site-specific integrase-resolvase